MIRLLSKLFLVLLALAFAFPVFAAEKKAKKKKKAYDYDDSRYKAYHALADEEPRTYRFDERGNPILPPDKKKKTGKKKKKEAEEAPACEAESCGDAKAADGAGSSEEAPSSAN